MNLFLLIISTVTLFLVIVAVIEITLGKRSIRFLKDISPEHDFKGDKVSIVIPARNEEKEIEVALKSVLAQSYNDFEVIAIDDRSTDQTAEILEGLAKRNRKLQVHYISMLPGGWLGKNHALQYGAKQAVGKLLLFADADVVMHPSAIKRAVYYMQENNLDHMVVGPQLKISGKMLKIALLTFSVNFMLFFQPWKAKNPTSKKFIGGGAFSLMRREAYEAIGTMQALPMSVADDLKLGQLLKQNGFRQEFLAGGDMISLEWYATLKEMIHGLTKNTFAVMNFSFLKVIGISVALVVQYLGPLFAIFAFNGLIQVLNIFIILGVLLLYLTTASFIDFPRWLTLGFPIGVIINIYVIWKSALVTLKNKGITWRDSHYALDELKKFKS